VGYLGSFAIDDLCTFYANSHTPSTGAAVDADAVPGYRVYEDETATPILTGSMALLDDTNTTGFYSEQITLSAANGFEAGKSYCIRITLVVGGVTGVQIEQLQVGAKVDVRLLGGSVQSATDLKDLADDGYDPATNKVQGVVLVDTLTAYTGNTVQTGDSFARIGATGSGLTSLASQASVTTIDDFLDTEVAAILAAVDTEVAALVTGVNVTQLGGSAQSMTDLKDLADTGYDPITHKVQGVVLTDTLTTYTGNTVQTGDSFARIGATGSGLTTLATQASITTLTAYVDTEVAAILAAVDTEVAAIKAVTDLLPNAGALTSLATAASIATLQAFVDTEVAAILAAVDTEVASILAAVDTEVAAIKAVTDLLPNGGALTSVATAASIATLQAFVDTEVAAILAAVDTEVAAIKAKTDNLPTDPADESSLQAAIAALNDVTITDVTTGVNVALQTLRNELGGVPDADASLQDKLGWLFMIFANPMTQTAGLQTLRTRANSADVATAAAASDGTTTTRGAFT
jgi:hypothetical protein